MMSTLLLTVFHDFDVPGDTEHQGADLAAGWRIAIPERRTARLIRYKAVTSRDPCRRP